MDNQSKDGSSTSSQFASQTSTAEDLLKSQTVGLVNLDDFRKRRAEVLELKEREARDKSGTSTPLQSGSATPKDGVSSLQPPKKKRKAIGKGKLSFGFDDEEGVDSAISATHTPRSATPDNKVGNGATEDEAISTSRRLGPNTSIGQAPKAVTKASAIKEAQTREQLRKEFLVIQEAVKTTEIYIPFVFYEGTNIPGGVCKVKKGDHVWFFLDKARKVGAERGVGGENKSKREWARVGVDDLLLVRGEIIIPHHYDFYYFIINKTIGFDGPLFDYSAQPPPGTPTTSSASTPEPSNYDPLARPKKTDKPRHAELEGANADPSLTKVVDRRWYERNKHIFPASVWEEFDPDKDYTKGIRKDPKGNAFFFS